MTRTAAAIVAASLMATSAHAATVWQGEAIIDSASGACATIPSAPVRPDSVLKTVLKPKNLPGNSNITYVSFIGNDIAMFALALNNLPSGNAAGFGNTTSGLIKANVTIAYSAFQQIPATIAAGTPDVTLRGTINNFLFVTGCDVTFRAAYTKRN